MSARRKGWELVEEKLRIDREGREDLGGQYGMVRKEEG